MRRIFYFTTSLLFLGGSAFGQNNEEELKPATAEPVQELQKEDPSKTGIRFYPATSQGQDGLRAACHGDTIFYEDFANGFAGNNDSAVAWDTTGVVPGWNDCPSNCGANHTFADPGPLQSTTASNGYVNLDVLEHCAAGCPPNKGLAMTMDKSLDLSGANDPALAFQSTFYDCCDSDHEVLVQVSLDGGATWPDSSSFDLRDLRDEFGINQFGKVRNPEHFFIPLGDAIQGNPSNVRVRFFWDIAIAYNWYIDDIVIREHNRNDASLATETSYTPDSSFYFNEPGGVPSVFTDPLKEELSIEYSHVPRCNFNCMNFGGKICNEGENALNDVQLKATVVDTGSGSVVWDGTSQSVSVGASSCVNASVIGSGDTTWTNECFFTQQKGGYAIQYEVLVNDTTDCVMENNMGGPRSPKLLHVTEDMYAIDEFERLGMAQTIFSSYPDQGGGGSYNPIAVYNTFDFTWFDRGKDTIKEVCFFLHPDSTDVDAGPITAGISTLASPNGQVQDDNLIYGKSDGSYFVQSSDIGEWVCLEITLDSNGNDINGLPVPIADDNGNPLGAHTTAFVDIATTGGEQAGIATSGSHREGYTWYSGDFSPNFPGEGLYGGIFPHAMVRVKMNEKASNCNPIQSVAEEGEQDDFDLGQNRPNPFNGNSTVRYELGEKAGNVSFTVRDVTGKVVMEEGFGSKAPGEHRVDLKATDFDAGVYYYTLNVDGERSTRRMVVTE